MKIAYITTYYPTQCGIATYTNYLIRAIKNENVDVEIKVIAEHCTLQIKSNKFEVIPC